jgi:DHA1 family bicyclomycin/chloramphenicol resistance-like MFS transporter
VTARLPPRPGVDTAPPRHLGVAVMVGVALALLPLSTDLYLASLPALRRHFELGVADVQLTLSVFVAALALAQLVYGPLSDRFGRRPVLLAGIAIYVVASVACAAAQSIEQLLVARFFQAVGACSGQVIGRAIVRDVYGAQGAARMLGYITAGTALAPVLGPPIGGLLTVAFGWRASFVLVAAVGAGLLVVAARALAESNAHPDPHATALRGLVANYGTLLRDRRFVGYALCMAASYGAVFAWISGSAFVLIESLQVPVAWFGVWFGATVAPYVIANLITARLVMRVGPARMMRVGVALALLAGLLLAGLALAGVHTLPAILLPVALFLFATGFNQPCAIAGAIGPFPRLAGTASALMGFLQMASGAAVGVVVGRLHDGTPLPTALAMAAMTLVLAAVYGFVVPRAAAPATR